MKKGGVAPLLPNVAASSVSQYFRFMNKIDYSKLSFREKMYINRKFTSIADVEKHGADERTVSIYKKIVENIQLILIEMVIYSCDGGVRKEGDHFSLSTINQLARSNHVTFGIYYTEAYDTDKEDDIVAEIVCNLTNDLQEKSNWNNRVGREISYKRNIISAGVLVLLPIFVLKNNFGLRLF